MAIRILWSALGPVLRRLAFAANVPATPPPNVRRTNQKIRKLGKRQTPSKRSAGRTNPKKGKKRGREFYRVTWKKLRPPALPPHQPQNQPQQPLQPLWLCRSLLLLEHSPW